MIYPPRRKQRAMMLTAHIMHVIEKYLPYNDENNARRNISRELEELFYATGVDIITEADRIQAGCMPRDHNGLTLEEIKVIDARYLKAMLEPLTFDKSMLYSKDKS
jgi:hypothetical protein